MIKLNVSKDDIAIIVAPAMPAENRGMIGTVEQFVPPGAKVRFKVSEGTLVITYDEPAWLITTPRAQRIDTVEDVGEVWSYTNVVADSCLRKISGPPTIAVGDLVEPIIKIIEEEKA